MKISANALGAILCWDQRIIFTADFSKFDEITIEGLLARCFLREVYCYLLEHLRKASRDLTRKRIAIHNIRKPD